MSTGSKRFLKHFKRKEVHTSMSGDTFAKMMEWISGFIAKMVELIKGLMESVSNAMNSLLG